MPQISRATLPEEFHDITSIKLLLEPEPQYLHAQLAKMAMSAYFDAESSLGLQIPGRQFGTNGAPYANAEDGRLTLSDGLFDQAVVFVSELGNSPGHTVRLNRPIFESTVYGLEERSVPAGALISQEPIAVKSAQVPITLQRLAGPYSVAQGQPAPIGVDRFDSKLSMHRSANIAGMNLKRDFDANLDHIMVKLFDQAAQIVRPAGMTDDDTPAVAGDYPMSLDIIAEAERKLDEANIPRFANGKRALVISPYQAEQLAKDTEFQRLAKFHVDFNPLFRGSMWADIGAFTIFKSNTLTKTANTNSVLVHRAQAFGPGAVGIGQGEMPRSAQSADDNYGENAKVIWIWYAGMATLDSRFTLSIRTS